MVLTPEKKEKPRKHLGESCGEKLPSPSSTVQSVDSFPGQELFLASKSGAFACFYLGQDSPQAAPGPGLRGHFSSVNKPQRGDEAVQNYGH